MNRSHMVWEHDDGLAVGSYRLVFNRSDEEFILERLHRDALDKESWQEVWTFELSEFMQFMLAKKE